MAMEIFGKNCDDDDDNDYVHDLDHYVDNDLPATPKVVKENTS